MRREFEMDGAVALSSTKKVWYGGRMTYKVTAAAVLIIGSAAPIFGQPVPAGRIKLAAGEAFVLRQNAALPARAGEQVFVADAVRTGNGGRVAITLKDDTRIAVGPHSEVRLDTFEFAPGEGRFGLSLRLARGLLAYVSGRIARLSPESARLETPSAVVGIRGTRLVLRVDAP
jgi:hypothetical protein